MYFLLTFNLKINIYAHTNKKTSLKQANSPMQQLNTSLNDWLNVD